MRRAIAVASLVFFPSTFAVRPGVVLAGSSDWQVNITGKATIRAPVVEGLSAGSFVVQAALGLAQLKQQQETHAAIEAMAAKLIEIDQRLSRIEQGMKDLGDAVLGLYPYIAHEFEQADRNSLLAKATESLVVAKSYALDPSQHETDLAIHLADLRNARRLLTSRASALPNFGAVGHAMLAEAALRHLRFAAKRSDGERRDAIAAFEDYAAYFGNAASDKGDGLAALEKSLTAQRQAVVATIESWRPSFTHQDGGPIRGLWIGAWKNGITPMQGSCWMLLRVDGDLDHGFSKSEAVSLRRTQPIPCHPEVQNYLPDDYPAPNWDQIVAEKAKYDTVKAQLELTSEAVPACRKLANAAKALAGRYR